MSKKVVKKVIKKVSKKVTDNEEPIYDTARHLLHALNDLDETLLDLPLVLVHGKKLSKPNLVSGIVPSPVSVNQALVDAKPPSLLALASLQ